MQFCHLDHVEFLCIYLLAMYCETAVKLYCVWNSFLELGQAHYKSDLLLWLLFLPVPNKPYGFCGR